MRSEMVLLGSNALRNERGANPHLRLLVSEPTNYASALR